MIKYLGSKRRLVPVRIDGELPPPGAPLLRDGREVGTMRSSRGGLGMAVVRLEALEHALTSDQTIVTPLLPDWLRV